jgi:hypothetical protein
MSRRYRLQSEWADRALAEAQPSVYWLDDPARPPVAHPHPSALAITIAGGRDHRGDVEP